MRNRGYVNAELGILPEDLDFCKRQPSGTSAFVRDLIENDRKSPLPPLEPEKRSTSVNSGYVKTTVSLTMEQIGYCAGKPAGRSPYIRRLVGEFRRQNKI